MIADLKIDETGEVDVIIPAYNAARTVLQTIQSVLSQSWLVAQIIVVDDGSTDGPSLVGSLRDQRVTLLTKPNGGQGSARLKGALHSRAEFILFLDADDVLMPNAIENLRQALIDHRDSPLAYCRAEPFGEVAESAPESRSHTLDDAEGKVWDRLIDGNFIRTPGCVLIRRTELVRSGNWERSAKSKGHEDWDLWLRLAEIGPFARVTEPLLLYRVHIASFSHMQDAMDRSKLWVLRKHLARNPRSSNRWMQLNVALNTIRRLQADQKYQDAFSEARLGRWPQAFRHFVNAIRLWPRCLGWAFRRPSRKPKRTLVETCRASEY